jgi:hypothetical protein
MVIEVFDSLDQAPAEGMILEKESVLWDTLLLVAYIAAGLCVLGGTFIVGVLSLIIKRKKRSCCY